MEETMLLQAQKFQKIFRILRSAKPDEPTSNLINIIAGTYFNGDVATCNSLYNFIRSNTKEGSVEYGDLNDYANKCLQQLDNVDSENSKTLSKMNEELLSLKQDVATKTKEAQKAKESGKKDLPKLKKQLKISEAKLKLSKGINKFKSFLKYAFYATIVALMLGSGVAGAILGFGLETLGVFIGSISTGAAVTLGGLIYVTVLDKDKRKAREKKNKEKLDVKKKAVDSLKSKTAELNKSISDKTAELEKSKKALEAKATQQKETRNKIEDNKRKNQNMREQINVALNDNISGEVLKRVSALDKMRVEKVIGAELPDSYNKQLERWIGFAQACMYYYGYTENSTQSFDNICQEVENMIKSTHGPMDSAIQSFEEENMREIFGITNKEIVASVLGINLGNAKPKDMEPSNGADENIV